MPVALGLDLGEKRVGVSVTDESGIVATALTVIEFRGREQLLGELKRLVDEYHPSRIIVGLPKMLKGEIGPAAEKVIRHVEWFKTRLPAEWVLWDERLTTHEVERILLDADLSRSKRKRVRDSLAAQRILQSFVDHGRTS